MGTRQGRGCHELQFIDRLRCGVNPANGADCKADHQRGDCGQSRLPKPVQPTCTGGNGRGLAEATADAVVKVTAWLDFTPLLEELI